MTGDIWPMLQKVLLIPKFLFLARSFRIPITGWRTLLFWIWYLEDIHGAKNMIIWSSGWCGNMKIWDSGNELGIIDFFGLLLYLLATHFHRQFYKLMIPMLIILFYQELFPQWYAPDFGRLILMESLAIIIKKPI